MLQYQSLPDITGLRDAVARIEAGRSGTSGGAARRRRLDPSARLPPVRLGDGTLPLDDLLAGGLRRGALHEIVAHHKRDDAAAAGFALTVAGRCAGSSPLVWVIEDCAASETGSPYRPGLAAHGIDPDRLILVRTKDARSTLWARRRGLETARSGRPGGALGHQTLRPRAVAAIAAGRPGRAGDRHSASYGPRGPGGKRCRVPPRRVLPWRPAKARTLPRRATARRFREPPPSRCGFSSCASAPLIAA